MSSLDIKDPTNTDHNGGNARVSEDGVYRYYLTRYWDRVESVSDRVCWLMLNPSTADAFVDDPTIRRCKAFSKAWGFGGMVVVNVFALRATDPKELVSAADPVGPENDEWIRHFLGCSDLHIAAWGASWPRQQAERVRAVEAMAKDKHAHVLGLTDAGQPRHPLYVRGNTVPQRWL